MLLRYQSLPIIYNSAPQKKIDKEKLTEKCRLQKSYEDKVIPTCNVLERESSKLSTLL